MAKGCVSFLNELHRFLSFSAALILAFVNPILEEVLVGMWHKGVYYSPLGNIPLHHPPSQAANMP